MTGEQYALPSDGVRFWIDKPGVEEYRDVTASVLGDRATVTALQVELYALKDRARRYEDALREIAGEDYRGNRPHSATVAWKALNPDG